MKNRNLTSKMIALAVVGVGLLATSCKKDSENPIAPPLQSGQTYIHIGQGTGFDQSEEYVYPFTVEQLSNPQTKVVFQNEGHKLGVSRTNRFYSSPDGKYLYNLAYGLGSITKYETYSTTAPYYKELKTLDLRKDMGQHPRWRVINEKTALLYTIIPDHRKENDQYKESLSSLRIMRIDLENFTVVNTKDILLPKEQVSGVDNIFVNRVDSPIIVGDKVYIGVSKQGYNGTKVVSTRNYPVSTIVMDYPSFDNVKIISSDLGKGQAYGYRSPAYFEYNGSVYHNSMNDTKIFKITNGAYDNGYDFDLAKALGIEKVDGTGIFYVGNGIAYMPFYDASKGSGSDSKNFNKTWSIARVDLNTKTAIKMNVPNELWLWYYQSAKVVNGKLYVAICPLDKDGNIYIFDPAKADANGFEKGATLKVAGDSFYTGAF